MQLKLIDNCMIQEEIILYGLTYNCPTLQRQDDCPFKEIDHHYFKNKVKWVKGLSKEEKKAILEHHQVCSGNR